MSDLVLLKLLNELGKIKCEACRAFYLFFATSFINLIYLTPVKTQLLQYNLTRDLMLFYHSNKLKSINLWSR